MTYTLFPAFSTITTLSALLSFTTPSVAQKPDSPTLSITAPAQADNSAESKGNNTLKKEPKVTVYSAEFCSYCTSAKDLLDTKNVKYEVIDVQGKKHLIDEMEKATGQRTVPQIIINGKHIGGYLSLLGANLTGELDDLLKDEKQ